MQIKKTFSNSFAVLFFVVTLVIASYSRTSFAEISTESYCQITIQSMQQEVSNLQGLVALANQYSDDPQTLAEQESIKIVEHDQERNTLFASFGTTAEEYALYIGKHNSEVKTYLENNTDVKQQIDNFTAQINDLLSQHQALKEQGNEPPPPLP